MRGWKTWVAAVLVACGAGARYLGHEEISDLLMGLGAAFGAVGLGHKLEKNATDRDRVRIGVLIAAVMATSSLMLTPLSWAGAPCDGSKAVASAGTAVALGSQRVRWVDIQADCGNTDSIYVGSSTVSATSGIELTPCSMLSIGSMQAEGLQASFGLGVIYIDAAVNGEGAVFSCWTYP